MNGLVFQSRCSRRIIVVRVAFNRKLNYRQLDLPIRTRPGLALMPDKRSQSRLLSHWD